ncbi:MAG: molybdopterin-guanine dinucleotide biosynthesis protein B [Methylophilaceae bacterium]|nr:molybdopterin-guanine dinucleotide biosynthesis protein B [Methylophilaceae bacterium]
MAKPSPTTTIPILSFCAYASNSGKTTLLTQLIPSLIERGLRVSVIKHAHHTFDIDYPGKDSYKLREAGAVQTMIASKSRWALMTELSSTPDTAAEPNLNTLLAQLDTNLTDLVLVEGFRHEAIPKIEVFRASLGQPLLAEQDSTIIAIASDTQLTSKLPLLDLNNIEQIANFVTKFTSQ